MKIGISMGATESLGDFGIIAQKIESLGFDSVWLPEHPVMPVNHNSVYAGSPDGKIPAPMYLLVNPLIALARASATTTRLGLGTGINLITEHNPIDLAKLIATLDFYSGGRFLFGIGTGWFREESEIMGVDFDHRWSQAKEYVLAMKEIWTKEEAQFHGKYVDFPPIICNPKPVRKPHPPVLLGGNSPNVLRRVVQWGDGWIPIRLTPDDIKSARGKLNELCSEAGRDPRSIEIIIHGQLFLSDSAGILRAGHEPGIDLMKRFQDAGADRLLLGIGASQHLKVIEELESLAEAVL